MGNEVSVSVNGPTHRRIAAFVGGVHVASTLILGYLVVPRFNTLAEPPLRPLALGWLIGPLARIFYFPLVSWADAALITDNSYPSIGIVIANSALVALAVAVIWRMASRFDRAVA